jgi:predicted aspartyl protease
VVSVEQSMAQALLQQGQAVPPPKTGFALIDTGASFTCIDDQAAKDLGLPIIDVASISSASHAQHQCNVYPVQISIPPMLILQSPRTIGAALAAQGLLVLIGRDVLQHCLLVYNGGTGSITLSL